MTARVMKQSFEEYQKIRKPNASALVAGLKSAKAMKRVLDGESYQTPQMQLGVSIHALTLEPDVFEESHCVVPDFHLHPDNVTKKGDPTESKATTFYKSKIKEFAEQNAGKKFLSRKEYDSALCCIESMRSNPVAAAIFEAAGSNVELTVEGVICGVEMKGRIDVLSSTAIADIKTTASVDVVAFGRSACNLRYPFRMAIYRELVRQSSCDRECMLIAVETSGEFDCVVYSIPSVVLDNEFKKVIRILGEYKKCFESGVWPGVDRGDGVVQLYVPQWAMEDAGDDLLVAVPDISSDVETEVYF